MQKRKSIITENNELITTLLVQKKDLEKIIEFTFDLTGEIKQIYDANLNLDSDEYIEITSPDIMSFIMNINWIIDEDTYNRFSISELEIAFKQILNILENIKEKSKKNENIDIKKYLELEFKKYKFDYNKLYYVGLNLTDTTSINCVKNGMKTYIYNNINVNSSYIQIKEYKLEYGTNTLSMHLDALKKNDKVVLVDDLLATGGTALAACHLCEKLGAEVVGVAFVVDLIDLKGKELLHDYDVYTLVEFEGE